MNRREALIAVLAAPAAASKILVQEKQAAAVSGTVSKDNTIAFGTTSVLSNKMQLILELTDKDQEPAGVYELSVIYKGKQIKFTAQEIWDALNETPQTQFKNFTVTP